MAPIKPLRDGPFSFDGNVFLAEAAGGNHYSRATIERLRAHFHRGLDRPGHWYEAQLIHYGKHSSMGKGAAQKRLEQVVRKREIELPEHIKKIEEKLRRKWKVQEAQEDIRTREKERATGVKRPLSEVSRVRKEDHAPNKRHLTETPTPANTVRDASSQTAALEGRLVLSIASGVTGAKPLSARDCMFNVVKSDYPNGYWDGILRLPPSSRNPGPKRSPGVEIISLPRTSERAPDSSDPSIQQEAASRRDDPRNLPLGPISGRYEIDAAHDGRPHSLTLVVDGRSVWGYLQLARLTGVLHIFRKPRRARPTCEMVWRGHNTTHTNGARFHDGTTPGAGQYITFLGGGQISGRVELEVGKFCYFTGSRVGEQEEGREIGVWEMRRRWRDVGPGVEV